jgi:hypothetical protein
MITRFECRGRLVCEASDWDGPVPSTGDKVTLTLNARHNQFDHGTQVTFLVTTRRFIRAENEMTREPEHTILLDVEPT